MLTELVKSGTLAMLLMAVGFAAGIAVTGSIGVAVGIALLSGSFGSFAYLLHERLWRLAHARR